jgi:hypothetical protein
MKPEDQQKFEQAVALFQQGHKAKAHAALLALSKTYPTVSAIWLWLAYTSDDLIFARSYLYRVKLLEPENASLPGAEKWLAEEETKRHQAERNAKKPARAAHKEPIPVQPATVAGKPANIPDIFAAKAPAQAQPTGPGPNQPGQTAEIKPATRGNSKEARPAPENPAGKVKKAKVRRKNRGKLVISLILLFIFLGLGGTIAAAIIMNGQSPDALRAAGFPVYSGATRLDLAPRDRETIINSYADTGQSGNVKNLEFEFYKLKKSDKNTALDFYDTELSKMGWLAPPRNSVNTGSFNLNSYQKAKQSFFVFTSEVPADAYPLPSVRDQVRADELLLIVFRTEEV